MIKDKDKCPYCKGKKYKGSKSCDECYREGRFRGRLSCIVNGERRRSQWKN